MSRCANEVHNLWSMEGNYMGFSDLFMTAEIKRTANCCHLLTSGLDEKVIKNDYGFSLDEIEKAKAMLFRFDDFAYCRG